MKTDELNFIEVEGTKVDEGDYITLYVGHRKTEDGEEAYPIRVKKPLTRDKAINAAEMQAYNLTTPLEVASFGTSLSRKHREDPDDSEVRDHDYFIDWVKNELTKIGV